MALSFLKNRFRQPSPSRNQLVELFQGNFFVMFLPVDPLFDGADSYALKYPYGNLFKNQICLRETLLPTYTETAYFQTCLASRKIVAVGLKDCGTLVFTNHRVSALFQILQTHYRNCTSYVFCATDNAGYFKKLEGGKIVRKIASHLVAEGIGNTPEVRGAPVNLNRRPAGFFKSTTRPSGWMTC